MITKEITYQSDSLTARIVVSEADVLQGAKRTRLKLEAEAVTTDDVDTHLARLFEYPYLIAAARSIEISGIEGTPTFEQFLVLPEALALKWERAVFDLNPHWLPEGSDEKKDS